MADNYRSGIATDALKDIVITLQMTLLQNLQLAWKQDTMVDFSVLQIASEDSRVNSVVALGQLYQRLSIKAPIQQVPLRLGPVPRTIESPVPQIATPRVTPVSRENSIPATPTLVPAIPERSPRRGLVPSSRGRWSSEKSPSPAIYNLFRRPKSDTVVSHRGSKESLVLGYLLPVIDTDKSDSGWLLKEVESGGENSSKINVRQSVSSAEISSDASSSNYAADLLENPWETPNSPINGSTNQSQRSSLSRRSVPTNTLEVTTSPQLRKYMLPCEENRFAGFCKARSFYQLMPGFSLTDS